VILVRLFVSPLNRIAELVCILYLLSLQFVSVWVSICVCVDVSLHLQTSFMYSPSIPSLFADTSE